MKNIVRIKQVRQRAFLDINAIIVMSLIITNPHYIQG